LHCHQYSPFSYGILSAILIKLLNFIYNFSVSAMRIITSARILQKKSFRHGPLCSKKLKVIFTEHGRFYPDRSSWKRLLINPLLALFTDEITSISMATKKALVQFERLPEKKIKVIYNGIQDLSIHQYNQQNIRDKLKIKKSDMVLGTISRLDPIKNHKMMLLAFKEIYIQQPDTKMLIVGDGLLRGKTEQLCIDLGIMDHIIFTGFIINPQSYLNIMDIFLLPSFSEGTSMTLLEAMSFGKPCIVTDAGGSPEIVIDRQTGIVIPNDDQSALSKACLTLLENKSLRIQYGQAGKQRFSRQFRVQKMISEFEGLYLKN
jgi:glycosyltransferase involved in cell wall biosynthesis